MKRIYPKEEACIGCRLCEVWCQVEHSRSKDIVRAFKKETPPPPRVVVNESGPISFGLQCRQCDEPACAFSCIAGAMTRDEETGLVTHDPEKCVGCWTCVLVCPRGVLRQDLRERRVVAKCDLCPDRETPACVQNCPNEALIVVEE